MEGRKNGIIPKKGKQSKIGIDLCFLQYENPVRFDRAVDFRPVLALTFVLSDRQYGRSPENRISYTNPEMGY